MYGSKINPEHIKPVQWIFAHSNLSQFHYFSSGLLSSRSTSTPLKKLLFLFINSSDLFILLNESTFKVYTRKILCYSELHSFKNVNSSVMILNVCLIKFGINIYIKLEIYFTNYIQI